MTMTTAAPPLMPSSSGLAMGLPVMRWINVPARPRAMPARIAAMSLGPRQTQASCHWVIGVQLHSVSPGDQAIEMQMVIRRSMAKAQPITRLERRFGRKPAGLSSCPGI